MIECAECRELSRRSFLKKAGAGLGVLAATDPVLHWVASTWAQSSGGSGNLLVLCQFNGGLDVLSFLSPFQNPVYMSKRPNLALGSADVTPLPDHQNLGINQLFPFFSELYANDQLAIVQQVGYPNPNGSHFESQEIYQFGVRNLASSQGTAAPWYQRLRENYFDQPFGMLDAEIIGDPARYGYPDRTYRQAAQAAFGRMARMQNDGKPIQKAVYDAYARIDTLAQEIRERTEGFESTGEARGQFHRAAALASANLGTQVLKVNYGGFDTHGSQREANDALFPRVNDEFRQFVDDLKMLGLWERTCICFYSEFGRRNAENGSPGTDHGHGGHMMLAGPAVRGGLHGQEVTTADLNADALPYYVDFRAVFGACISNWLGFDPRPVFQVDGETYDENVGSDLFA